MRKDTGCDTPYIVKLTKESSGKLGQNTSEVGCGQCYNCKQKRVSQWAFRLQKELEDSTSAYFVTLTYDTLNVPIIGGRYPMTLLKNSRQNERLKDSENYIDRSLQGFFKRLRYYEDEISLQYDPSNKKFAISKYIKYYACGEYGYARKRPHYHFIIFNLKHTLSINRAWSTAVMENGKAVDWIPFGKTDIDPDVNSNNIAYVLKYICKSDKKAGSGLNDNRIPEFSLMSKGLGKSFMTKEIETFYNKRLDLPYVINHEGIKVGMPRYYVKKMMTEETREDRANIIKRKMDEDRVKDKRSEKEIRGQQIARQALKNNYGKRTMD